MTKNALKIISDAMKSLGLEYAFMRYKVKPGKKEPLMYFTGEYQEIEPMYENGMHESKFLLNGWSRGTWLALEEAKDKICNYFNRVSGKTVIAEDGSAVAIFYASASVVQTGDADLKRIQINLDVMEWSVE